MKSKYVTKKKKEFLQWTAICNIFARSLCSLEEVLKQFNKLTALQRTEIKNFFSQCDETRRKKMPIGETSSEWKMNIMVDAHIIACEYDIDPLTAVLCVDPICEADEKIFIK